MRGLITVAKDYLHNWRTEILAHKRVIVFSVFLFLVSLVINYSAGKYTTETDGFIVPDLILNNIPAIDVYWLIVPLWGVAIFFLFFYPLFFKVRMLSHSISQFSFLLMVRSFFVILTHLKTPPDKIFVDMPRCLDFLFGYENDLFFSAIVAFLFLGFYIYKDSKIRYFLLICSILAGVSNLLMHQHYTIDVLAAFFITYSSYRLGNWLFAVIKK